MAETIKVALRIRPLVGSEKERGCQSCLRLIPEGHQIQIVGTDKAFTFNFVFGETVPQVEFYERTVKEMLPRLFSGYNLTVLAYGQTGSGKTHSMGTNYDGSGEKGVIPRAIDDIFAYIDDATGFDFKVTVSFVELYQENLYDLLCNKPRENCVVDIREDSKGVKIPGVVEQPVTNSAETIKCLIEGSAGRATGATAMNAQSSRSHAIFTITVYMQKKNDTNSATVSKFQLVDLAGSERSKKTKATGERFREGVNINKGLLALGNVISALGDDAQRGYISYRDSKLTRLLQDSLGGNSLTLMVACVSPADYNLDETLSTLRYADRARKIKNKPIVNQDPKSAEIARLNQVIQQLRLEKIADGTLGLNSEEVSKLRHENRVLQTKNRDLNSALSSALSENTLMFERALITQSANERLQRKLLELKETYDVTLSNITLLNITQPQGGGNAKVEISTEENQEEVKERLEKLKNMIADLNSEHKKNEEELQRHEYQSSPHHLPRGSLNDLQNNDELDEQQESHTRKQLDFNMELQELNRALAVKEQLASCIIANTNNLVDSAAIGENEAKIAGLEKEKDELLQQLKNAQTNTTKLSETRRQRVKELEIHISDLKKKVVEQARLIKLKEKDEEKIKNLNKEIREMKANKVKLIKLMRAEEQKFRTWKTQREKDLMRLKDQDRKRQNQIVRMEQMHSKQQTVWKRKVEEAAAVNKRLKEALAMQKQAQERRAQQTGKMDRIENWIEKEFLVMVSTAEAEHSLESLIEDRAILNEQLLRLRSDPELANLSDTAENIKQLTEEIEFRNAQIADLEQKIMDSDQENKSRTRWDTIQSMVDAKCALKKLFELAASIRRDSVFSDYRLKELNLAHQEALTKAEHTEKQLKEQSAKFHTKMSEIERNYEEKISVVLRQLRGLTTETSDENLRQRMRIQEEALEKMDHLRRELEELREENEGLKKKMLRVHSFAQLQKKPQKKKTETVSAEDMTKLLDDDDDDDVDVDDVNNDPDWKKTPLYKRLASMKAKRSVLFNNSQAVKRSSDGATKCNCKGKCSANNCSCRKMRNTCSESCKCSWENCVNRSSPMLVLPRKLYDNEDEENTSNENMPPTDITFLKDNSKKRKKSYFTAVE